MKTYVEFRSDAFPPYDDEEQEINPGRYGKRIAEFLAQGLTGKGFNTGEPIPEDWGWVVPIENDSFRMWIGCGNYPEYPDGFLCFIEPHTPTIKKFLFFGKIDTSEKVGKLQLVIDALLSAEDSIKEKKWWTYDEFNNPRAAIEG